MSVINFLSVQDGIGWLKRKELRLVQLLSDEYVFVIKGTSRKTCERIAEQQLSDLIKRLDTLVFDAGAMEKNLLGLADKGVKLEELVSCADKLLLVITNEAQREFMGQPEMCNVFLGKIRYFTGLLKAHTAAAYIKYYVQQNKPSVRQPVPNYHYI